MTSTPIPAPNCLCLQRFSALAGVTTRWVHQQVASGSLPREPDGTFRVRHAALFAHCRSGCTRGEAFSERGLAIVQRCFREDLAQIGMPADAIDSEAAGFAKLLAAENARRHTGVAVLVGEEEEAKAKRPRRRRK